MSLTANLRIVCLDLVDKGWNEVFLLHGLDLAIVTQLSDPEFSAKLEEQIPINHSIPGFGDFTDAGNSAIAPGLPAASLLYHALASAFVHPDGSDRPGNAENYPTLEQIDAVENYIYSRRSPDLSQLDNPAVVVFAYQYRSAARSPHGQHADHAYSRCGVSRVGTASAMYDPINRDFDSSGANGAIRAQPARYAAFLANITKPSNAEPIMSRQPGDHTRDFAFPVHKLFSGTECIEGADLVVDFAEFHRNEKLRRLHSVGGLRVSDGFDIAAYPFIRDSENQGDLVRLEKTGSSVVVVPIDHAELVRTAPQFNNRSGKMEPVRFVVPQNNGRNRFLTSLSLETGPRGSRPAPEYVNIRHRVDRVGDEFQIFDMNDLSRADFERELDEGKYEAAHFIDDSCDGVVSVSVRGLPQIASASNWHNLPAFSLVTAPDFLPVSDQIQIAEWSRRTPTNSTDHFRQGGPAPLCEGRRVPNMTLPLPGQENSQAFNDQDEGVVGIVGTRPLAEAPDISRRSQRFTSFLTDAASNVFSPGWDVSIDIQHGVSAYVSYGLGSPFPEDAKLCAALNSFWPAVAPDASRTFGFQGSPTAVPMLDLELGYHPENPQVANGNQQSTVGWDGEFGPFFEDFRGTMHINFANVDRSDYVSNSLRGAVNTKESDSITSGELIRRMEALQVCIASLPPSNDLVRNSDLWLIRAEAVSDWAQTDAAADNRLTGPGYIYEFATVVGSPSGDAQEVTGDGSRLRIAVDDRYICHISDDWLIFEKDDSGNWITVER